MTIPNQLLYNWCSKTVLGLRCYPKYTALNQLSSEVNQIQKGYVLLHTKPLKIFWYVTYQ